MAYTITFKEEIEHSIKADIFKSLQDMLKENEFKAEINAEWSKNKKHEVLILSKVRLTYKKPYCGQHPGECLIGGPKKVSNYLEWDDWVRFHGLVNEILDKSETNTEVHSNPIDAKGKFWIRKNNVSRKKYEYTEEMMYNRIVRVWNTGTEDQFKNEV